LTGENPPVPRPRIQGLSDLIFGLALSIGAIQLLTTQSIPHDQGQLLATLGAFGFSFLILINVWNRYTIVMSVIPVETTTLVRLNMLLLFLVVVEPYLFNLMIIGGLASPIGEQVSSFYGLDLGGMNLILAYFTHVLTLEDKSLIPREMIRRFKVTRDTLVLVGVLFLYSEFPPFWSLLVAGTPVRVIIWLLALPLTWVTRLFGNRK
jgi:uncharacterized membrane protein